MASIAALTATTVLAVEFGGVKVVVRQMHEVELKVYNVVTDARGREYIKEIGYLGLVESFSDYVEIAQALKAFLKGVDTSKYV